VGNCAVTDQPHGDRKQRGSATRLYQTIAEHFETWLELASAGQFDGLGDHHTPKPFVRQAFRKYLECGIFAHGFARAWCDDCGHDYLVAYFCKGRACAPYVTGGAWWRRRHTSAVMFFSACQCASGRSPPRSGCAT
jgi:hypothetical protein